MVKHNIILSNSYSEGKRIALHFADTDNETIQKAIDTVSGAYGGKLVPFSTHMLHTDSETWDSVVKSDPYFADVFIIDNLDNFVELIRKNRYLLGQDVAKYILSRERCTHTRIEKLTYLCYADYLCETRQKLFTDEIYAFQYGPVVETVLEIFGDHSKKHPAKFIENGKEFYRKSYEMPHKSRILFSEDGQSKVVSINNTLKRYENVSTDDLVKLTHKCGSPWHVTYNGKNYVPISDEAIFNNHQVELNSL